MKKELESKKLVLSKQTLRLLSPGDLANVKGARPLPTADAMCATLMNCRQTYPCPDDPA